MNLVAACPDRDRHGPRRPRQDEPPRRDPHDQRRGRRAGRHHPAHRRVRGHHEGRQARRLPGHPGPRGVHLDARPRRQGHRHRGDRRGGGRRRHAPDAGGHQPREGGEGAARHRDEQDRQAGRQPGPREERAGRGRRRRRGLRRRHAARRRSPRRRASGLDELLEIILLVADLQELKANPKRAAVGTVDRGASSTRAAAPSRRVIVQTGTLRVGDVVVVGNTFGKVKALENAGGKRIKKAGPATAVVVLGLADVPEAGDVLRVVADEKTARSHGRDPQDRAGRRRGRGSRPRHPRGPLPPDPGRPGQGAADHPQGRRVGLARRDHPRPAAAVSTDEVEDQRPATRRPATSPTTTSCWRRRRTRSSSGSTPGSPTRPAARPRPRAWTSGSTTSSTSSPTTSTPPSRACSSRRSSRSIEGRAEVRQIFKVGKSTVIAGCYVTDGRIVRTGGVRVWRGGKVVATDKMDSLRRFRDDVREVAAELRVRHRPRRVQRPGRGRHHRVLHQQAGAGRGGLTASHRSEPGR